MPFRPTVLLLWRRSYGQPCKHARRKASGETKHEREIRDARRSSLRDDPAYTPQQQPRHGMRYIAWAWAFGLPTGVATFLFTKYCVEKRRVANMRSRRHMRDATEGEYESPRYGKVVEGRVVEDAVTSQT